MDGFQHQFPAVVGLAGAELRLRRLAPRAVGHVPPAGDAGAPGRQAGPRAVRPEVLMFRWGDRVSPGGGWLLHPVLTRRRERVAPGGHL